MSITQKVVLGVLAVIVLFVGGFYALNNYIYTEKQADSTQSETTSQDYKNLTYTIDGRQVTLVDGVSTVHDAPAPGLESTLTVQYFGFDAEGDINEDGVSDISFLITQEGVGDEVLHYLVSAIRTDSGYVGTNAVLIGDRIIVESVTVTNGIVVVEYVDRGPDEPMTVPPSRNRSQAFAVMGTELVSVQTPD